MGAFRYLIFAAVAFSLSVYAYRAYRKWLAPKPDPDPGAPSGPDAAPGGPSSVIGRPTPAPARPLPKPPAAQTGTRGFGFTDPRTVASESEAGSESLVQAVIREELAKKQGIAPASPAPTGRSGLFAAADGDDRAARVSVAAALTGVRLPGDLVPLVGDAATADPHHVLFHATETPAAQIGRELGDELERLGFQVRSETDTVAVATKGTVELRITLHPDAANERLDGRARFPTTGPTSVVIELET